MNIGYTHYVIKVFVFFRPMNSYPSSYPEMSCHVDPHDNESFDNDSISAWDCKQEKEIITPCCYDSSTEDMC